MTKQRFILLLAVCMLLLGFEPSIGWAEQLPLWEVGAGVAGIDFPKYRGSNERRAYLLPVPYFTYHGDFLQVSRQSARGLIFRSDRVEVDISVNGSIPASSKDTQARSGMPNLDATVEIGPQLRIHLYYDEKKETNFDLRFPVRSAFATDFSHFHDVGWIFQPQMDLDLNDIRHTGWNLGLAAGPIYADKRYNQYFYNVEPQYAAPSRPAYTAHGGYAGYQIITALGKRFPNYWTGGFMKWDNLGSAVFADSPLVTSRHYFTIGWSITWILDKSERMVEVKND